MTASKPTLLLASASARRVRLLGEAGASFEQVIPEVDESDCSACVKDTVLKNARLKAAWAQERFPHSAIISADTAIEFQGRLIGKPFDIRNAREHLRSFSGKTHEVLTGICCSFPGKAPYTDVAVSPVTFRDLSEELIRDYFSLVDPLDKAGSYDIGSHGDMIVASYEGSMTNIIGLPMEVITPWLQENGFLT